MTVRCSAFQTPADTLAFWGPICRAVNPARFQLATDPTTVMTLHALSVDEHSLLSFIDHWDRLKAPRHVGGGSLLTLPTASLGPIAGATDSTLLSAPLRLSAFVQASAANVVAPLRRLETVLLESIDDDLDFDLSPRTKKADGPARESLEAWVDRIPSMNRGPGSVLWNTVEQRMV